MLSRRIQPKYGYYSYSAWFPRIMKSRDRRMMLLCCAGGEPHPDISPRSLSINCEGGLARKDPDIKYLVRRGYLEFKRVNGYTGLSMKMPVRRTYAVITEAGRKAIKLGKL